MTSSLQTYVILLLYDINIFHVTAGLYGKRSKKASICGKNISDKLSYHIITSAVMLESVFNVLVQPYFNYCSEVWGHCNKGLSNKLQKLQNRAARILTFSSYDTSADPLFVQLNWRRLDTQRQIQVATMVYKSIHGLAPDYLGSLFTKYDPPYNLRNSENKLAVPLPRTNFLKNSFSYNGAVIWNSLSPELRQAKSLQSFRNGCRNFFL